jgi:hypothetical protein
VGFFTPVYCGLMAILSKEALAELKGSFLELWSKTWPILAATAAMALFVFLLREFALGAVPEPPLVELVLLSVSGAATYAAALFTVGRSVIGEGTQVVGWILRRQAAD